MIFLANYKPLALLPNAEGFEFIGLRRDHTEVRARVVKDAEGMHRISDGLYPELIGWRHVQ